MSAAYDIEPWSELMVAVVGAMAALAGLFFVALSINVDQIVRLRRLPGRAAATVVMLVILLLAGVIGLIPGQSTSLDRRGTRRAGSARHGVQRDRDAAP